MSTVRHPRSRAFSGFVPFLLVGLALPLLAPTCGGFQPGVKTFAKGSLVIPMDVCYQCTRQSADGVDTATANCTKTGWASQPSGNTCPQALSQGDVLKAYGLVYQLIRNDVPVYWVIDPQKAAVDAPDLAIQFNPGFPVAKLDWASGQAGAPPTSEKIIRYLGGPFVVDGSDAAKALAVMRANASTFSVVNVHVASVAFQAPVSKTMAGGWSAGGTVAPKLALLNIASGNLSRHGTQTVCTGSGDTSHSCDANFCLSDPKNAEPVIEGYLSRAGIGSGTAGGTSAAGAHGQIYDRLVADDFIPAPGGDWTTTNLYKNGYQVLWVPHWLAPGSCRATASSSGSVGACACLSSRLTTAEVDAVLQTIGAFSKAGNDVFAECAGLGSFEGAFSGLTSTSYTTDYADGDPSTRFQTKTGVRYNLLPNNPFPTASLEPDGAAARNYGSPLLQIGDFPFKPYSGAIEDFKPDDTTSADRNYQPGVTRLIGARYASGSPSVTRDWDYFTLRPPDTAAATRHGTVVYLAGHSYSGVQGSYQAAGSRLVVNTLFNLGAACTSSGVACDTGLMGVCSRGTMTCDANGQQICTPTVLPNTRPEICNGLDDDCNGLVDENLEQGCYDGPPGTQGVGACRAGVKTCQQAADGSYGYSACHGEVVPTAEVCNGIDDDCNGTVDDGADGKALSESCYSGPPSTLGIGTCRAGTRACQNGSWGVCDGEVTPLGDPCSSPEAGTVGADRDCNGQLDACGTCVPNTDQRPCYDGPTGTDGHGPCKRGVQTCNALGQWGVSCVGQVVPQAEVCNDGVDQGCHGDLSPLPGASYTGPVGSDDGVNKGLPGSGHDGPPYCNACGGSGWTAPSCWTGPTQVPRGSGTVATVFQGATNASVCARGHLACVDGALGACLDQVQPGPELCNGKDDDCNGLVDDGAQCGAGFACENGVCVYAACSPEVPCQAGYDCVAGHCKLSTCGSGGLVCQPGDACDAETGTCSNPCAKITCGTGATCAGGYCTGGACYAAGCPAGELCRAGSCVPDACSGVICPAGTFCRQGDCVQSCAFRTCGPSETCSSDGFCVADPCAGKSCGATQTCVDGTCQADACLGLACGAKQHCSNGACLDDPCEGVSCPIGQCRDGQCYAVATPSHLTGAGTTTTSSGGCGCGSGEGSPLAFLALLLAVPLARRRRPGGAALGLALLALAGAATGCKKTTTTFDPAACGLVTPALATCEGEQRCVDVLTDPAHCGSCGRICEAGNGCFDGFCGSTSQVAPFITAVDPATAGTGGRTKVAIRLTGERFAAGATVRAVSQGGSTSQTAPAAVTGTTQLTAELDLSEAPVGTWSLRVVNPDLVVSNARPLAVVIPTPAITAVVPDPVATPPGSSTPAVEAGGERALVLQGTGFMVSSVCRFTGGAVQNAGLPSELSADGLSLRCTLDATSLQPGQYEVWVHNTDDRLSAHAPFQIVSAQPALTTLAPSGVAYNSVPAPVQLFGSGFDVTSKAWLTGTGLTPAALATTLVDSTRLLASAVDLRHCPTSPCPTSDADHHYFLEVRNGALASEKVELVVDAQTRAVEHLAPPSAWQGDRPTLTITGTGLTGGVLEYRPPGGSFSASTAGAVAPDGTSVSGVVDLVGSPAGSAPAGSWDVRLHFPSGATSASFALRVDSNQGIITATPVPAGGRAGESVAISLSAANLRPPATEVRVRFSDPGPGATFSQSLVPSAVPPAPATSGTVTAVLPLAGLHTGVYSISLVNPNGAAASAPYAFTVLPGTPHVDAVACTSVKGAGGTLCESSSVVKQQTTPVPIRITGSNFAQPDSAGNNGSLVLVSLPALSIVDQVVPQASVTVTSATQIDVALDTTTAIPSATAFYSVKVRNPGAPVSNELLDALQIQP